MKRRIQTHSRLTATLLLVNVVLLGTAVAAQAATVKGSGKANYLIGANGKDKIYGKGGNDKLFKSPWS